MSQSRHNPVQWHEPSFEDRMKSIYGADFKVGQHPVLRPRQIAVRFPFAALFFVVGLFFVLKTIAVTSIGADHFEDQRLAMAQGTLPEQIGAALLKIDPLTSRIVTFVSAD